MNLSAHAERIAVEDEVRRIYRDIAEHGVSEEELRRAKYQWYVESVFARDGTYALAELIQNGIGIGDWSFFLNFIEGVRQVRSMDIRRAAETYLTDDRLAVVFLSDGKNKILSNPVPVPLMQKVETETKASPSGVTGELDDAFSAVDDAASASERPAAGEKTEKTVAGIKVITFRTAAKDAVYIGGLFKGGGQIYGENPVTAPSPHPCSEDKQRITANMKFQKTLERMGASLSMEATPLHLRFSAQCLRKDMPAIVHLLAEALRRLFLKKPI